KKKKMTMVKRKKIKDKKKIDKKKIEKKKKIREKKNKKKRKNMEEHEVEAKKNVAPKKISFKSRSGACLDQMIDLLIDHLTTDATGKTKLLAFVLCYLFAIINMYMFIYLLAVNAKIVIYAKQWCLIYHMPTCILYKKYNIKCSDPNRKAGIRN
ncbi:hypothetical protein RFI_33882, partial [Reticulomyxa filosa]